jgi:F0F1-type ATP synthase delta subunit
VLLHHLKRRRALHLTQSIQKEIERLVTFGGHEPALVKSAHALQSHDRASVNQLLEKMTNKKIPLEEQTDTSLIGGFSIAIGDDVTDYSIASLLKQLHSSIEHATL